MITKALIKGKASDYTYYVRIPIFENDINDRTILWIAHVCYAPGNINAYKDGDVVYVDFENNEKKSPVIIGKYLCEAQNDAPSNYSFPADLDVSNSASLPLNTKIADTDFTEIVKLFRQVENIYTLLKEKVENEQN